MNRSNRRTVINFKQNYESIIATIDDILALLKHSKSTDDSRGNTSAKIRID